MKGFIKIAFLIFIITGLMGCIETDINIKVSSDGSGTVEETVLMRKDVVQMIQSMAPPSEQGKEQEIFPKEDIQKKALQMGEGVTFVSMEKVVTEKFEGYKAVYAFTDINNLRINENPGKDVPSAPGEETKEELITFQFKKGPTSTLIIRHPSAKFQKDKPATQGTVKPEDKAQQEIAKEMLKQMFQDMKVSISVEVLGSISKTNATHREGSKLTLLELDFNKILESQKSLDEFNKSKPDTMETLKTIVKDLPGIKVELNEVQIEFK
ncbi:MAG: hypothetical protein HY805_01450 [Nitrospirae bacterium]|nr:hypothetical protein [Nitrospirota bacterium]